MPRGSFRPLFVIDLDEELVMNDDVECPEPPYHLHLAQ